MIDVFIPGAGILFVDAMGFTNPGYHTGDFEIEVVINEVRDEDGNDVPDRFFNGKTLYAHIEDYLLRNDNLGDEG
jgi:hypothetical protein